MSAELEILVKTCAQCGRGFRRSGNLAFAHTRDLCARCRDLERDNLTRKTGRRTDVCHSCYETRVIVGLDMCSKCYTSNRRKAGKLRYDKIKHYFEKLPARFRSLKEGAKRRGLECSVDFETFKKIIEGGACFYCKGRLNRMGGGLDRVDNAKGYTAENVVACCKECNEIKGTRSQAEAIVMISALIAYRESRNHKQAKKRSIGSCGQGRLL